MPVPHEPSSNSLLARLRELEQETDFDFVIELVDMYLVETPKQIQAIVSALKSEDLHALMITAHTLKGSSLNLGAKSLGAQCLKLEEIGREAKCIPVGTGVHEIENEFDLVKSMLLAFKQSKNERAKAN